MNECMNIKNVVCIGAGYVGGPTMVKMAEKCPEIKFTVVDLSDEKINRWNSNDLPVFEPGLSEIVKKVRGKNLFFSTKISDALNEAQMVFIAVNTPTKSYGEGDGEATDLSYFMSAAKMICDSKIDDSAIIVEKSTVPIGTAEKMSNVFFRYNRYFQIVSNPEFIAEGTAMQDLENPDRVLIGYGEFSEGGALALKEIYKHWVNEDKIIMSNVWSSELAKLSANAFLAQRISSINSLASLCECTGADISEISKCIGMDSRIGSKFLKAGPGFGGSCFKKDVLNLIYILNYYGLNDEANYWRQVIKINELQPKRIIKRLISKMQGTLADKKIAVFGYSFKANTNDTRETPSKKIIEELLNEKAIVTVTDPMSHTCNDFGSKVTFCTSPYDAIDCADAIIIATDWDEFKNLNWHMIYDMMEYGPTILDCRGMLDHRLLANIGFSVYPIGGGYVSEEIPF